MAAATPVDRTSRAREANGYGVYVIELGKGANRYLELPLDLRFPVVYVGQSWHSAELRFRQHMEGGRLASSIVVRNGRWLRPDLYGHLDRVETKAEAEELEATHARTLAGLGFHAFYDGTLIRPDHTPPTPESEAMRTAEHVEVVSDYVDQAIFMAIAALNHPDHPVKASVESIADLLGTQSRPDQIPLEIPIPAQGRFAYLDPHLIVDRIHVLLASGFIEATPGGQIFIPEYERGLN